MPDNFEDIGTSTRQPGWHKVADPATGWFASKTTGWTADSFSGGLTVDFSAVVPAGTRAVRCVLEATVSATTGRSYWRKGGDTNISNTPHASAEVSHLLLDQYISNSGQRVLWLSKTYTVDFAVIATDCDLYIAYPMEYLL